MGNRYSYTPSKQHDLEQVEYQVFLVESSFYNHDSCHAGDNIMSRGGAGGGLAITHARCVYTLNTELSTCRQATYFCESCSSLSVLESSNG